MIVYVNNKEVDTQANNLTELAEQLEITHGAVAIAVESRMVPRSEWSTTLLSPGSHIIMIKAACGG